MSYLGKRWEQIRKGGAMRFVLVWGVLYWGVVTGLLFSVMRALLGSASFLESLRWSIVIFPLGGVLFGASMWAHFESKHQREK
jgi:hypothetical protein